MYYSQNHKRRVRRIKRRQFKTEVLGALAVFVAYVLIETVIYHIQYGW